MANPQIMAMVESYNRGILPPAQKNAIEELARRGEPGVLDAIKNYSEAALTMGSGAIAEPLSGLYGLAQGAIGGTKAAAEGVEQAQQALTYSPSAGGREALQNINQTLMDTPIVGEALQMVNEAPQGVGDYVFEKTGSPLAASLAAGGTGAGLEVGVPAGMAKRLTTPVSKEAMATANMFVNPRRLVGADELDAKKERIRKLKTPLTPAEKGRYTRIQNKIDADGRVGFKDLADFEELGERIEFQFEPNQDQAIWKKEGVFEMPTGQLISEIGDQDAVLKPLAKAYINPRGTIGEAPKMDQLTYRVRKNDQGQNVYDVTMRREGAQTSADIVDVPGLTETQLMRTFPGDVVNKMASKQGEPDVYDINADEWTEDALTIDEPYQLNTRQNLYDLVDHDKLRDVYPEMKDIEVDLQQMEANEGGSYNPFDRSMQVNTAKDAENVLSTLLHETQHAVQGIENYPRGGNPNAMGSLIDDAYEQERRKGYGIRVDSLNKNPKDVKALKDLFGRATGETSPILLDDQYLIDNVPNITRAAYNVDNIDQLKQLRDSDRPHKFVNHSNFYRDANEYRREYGIEPKGPKKSGPVKDWWRGLIDYSAEKTIEEMNPDEQNVYFQLRDDIAEGKTSPNKIRNSAFRVQEGLTPLRNHQRKLKQLEERRRNVDDNPFPDLKPNTPEQFQAYRDLYGEQQARDVQTRQRMLDSVRQESLPMKELQRSESRFATNFPYSKDSIVVQRR